LWLREVTRRFGSHTAVDRVSLKVRWGSVHALLGENGAGKSTLMRVAFGMINPNSGDVIVHGQRAHLESPADAIALGIGMVHQHFTNIPAMTVAENIALGHTGRYSAAAAATRVRDLSDSSGLSLEAGERASELPVGAQQRLEILKALGRDARILILDEPTAVLAPPEAAELLRWLRGFADKGNAVILVTHKLQEALGVADDLTVLRRGRCVMSSRASLVTAEMLATALLGESSTEVEGATAVSRDAQLIAHVERVRVADARGASVVQDVSLSVRSGDIVGIAAVEGAGQREFLRVLASRLEPTDGTVSLPTAIGFVPEDRHRDALVLDFSLTENVALRGAGARRGMISWNALRAHAGAITRAFDVRTTDIQQPAWSLSGGNQQKLVLARELDGNPPLIVAENPTRGLDIRAARDVHDRLRAAAASGAAVVVYSSDLDEVLALATRIVVMHRGRTREVTGGRDAVGRAMLGVE
jgi:simple sugar transport system ATP-binding protein